MHKTTQKRKYKRFKSVEAMKKHYKIKVRPETKTRPKFKLIPPHDPVQEAMDAVAQASVDYIAAVAANDPAQIRLTRRALMIAIANLIHVTNPAGLE